MSDQIVWLVLPLIGGLVLYAIISATANAHGQSLNAQFVALGELKDKTKDEIVAAVGPPNSVSAVAEGQTLCQWMATGYHIALLFDGDVCLGVNHEFRA